MAVHAREYPLNYDSLRVASVIMIKKAIQYIIIQIGHDIKR